MITVPVTINFDNTEVIGHMTVDEKQLPIIANYHFALGYILNKDESYTLVEVAAVPDFKFKPYEA